MGLDSVELVIAVEEIFEISIEDEDAGMMRTVDDLYEYVIKVLNADSKESCLSSIAFYKTRKMIIKYLDITRNNIKPTTKVKSVFRERDIREQWTLIEKKMGIELPSLNRPLWLINLINCIFLLFVFIAVLMYVIDIITGYCSFLFIIIGVLITSLLYRITEKFATKIPKKINLVSDISNIVMVNEYRKQEKPKQSLSKNEIWNILVYIIVEQLDVEAEMITKKATFIEDLGMG